MKRLLTLGMAMTMLAPAWANVIDIKEMDHYGPIQLPAPFMVDGTDAKGRTYDAVKRSDAPYSLILPGNPERITPVFAPSTEVGSEHILSFAVDNDNYTPARLDVSGLDNYTVYLDGKKAARQFVLKPSTHRVDLRYISSGEKKDSLKVRLSSANNAKLTQRTDGKRLYSILDALHGTRVTDLRISPDGKYLAICLATTAEGGKTVKNWKTVALQTGKTVSLSYEASNWMPKGAKLWRVKPGVTHNGLTAYDMNTGVETVLCNEMPSFKQMAISPDETFAIATDWQEGRKEDGEVYEILEPADRRPGFRNRSHLVLIDFKTGTTRPITFGNRTTTLMDIAPDSKRILATVYHNRLEERPTTLYSLIELNLETLQADTIVANDGFLVRAGYSPDGRQILLQGSPEFLGGIGMNVPEGRIPSMQDRQLYLYDIDTRTTTPLTRGFAPSVQKFVWSEADGNVYFTAEDRDCVNLFRLSPKTGKTERIELPVEVVNGFSVPSQGRSLAVFGEGASTPSTACILDTKTLRPTVMESPQQGDLADVELGAVEAWDFVNSRGDTICGRYYLPPSFDPSRKYPVIVHYYGGCSPTSRNFDNLYPHHAYAAQGYIVYVLEPSGATGFGQEFSSRHVNTAGDGPAQDIIEGTTKFIEEHPYADGTKVGCIGASYGGFTTQYLQTLTDMFAAAVSHAGISDHTGYWGEGYWGYSYNEVAMAGSYPWSRRDLYVDHSPVYNADKVKTPILFLHGDQDHNVPFGESVRMFTALKLLGKPTAFVAVKDQDHQILDYGKRKKWQDAIFAWFARYLKEDPTWWNSLYPPTNL